MRPSSLTLATGKTVSPTKIGFGTKDNMLDLINHFVRGKRRNFLFAQK